MNEKEVKKKEQKKGMKKNEKIVIAVLLIITIILIVILCARNSKNNDESTTSTSSSSISEDTTENEYVTLLDDGTKLNTSTKLNETKTLGGLEITDIQLTESNNMTQLLATVTNTSDETDGDFLATLTLVDESGETLIELKAYIPELDPGEDTQLNTSAGFDYSEAYDFVISK